MERLTERNQNGVGVCGADCEKPYPMSCMGCSKAYDAFERLTAYEDTGLEPSEILQLNDFSASQCGKLLAKNGELERELTAVYKALKMACACLPSCSHTDEYFIKRAREVRT